MQTLAVKYRPKDFTEVVGNETVVKILQRQLEVKQYKNCLLFAGSSGCGKTTLARIFANKVNSGLGEPIELDCSSHNSVEDVRQIIESADQRSLDSEYKIYILDECHQLSTSAWNAMLKLIEEPPKYTIFIFCTTEYHKVPDTIKNRCQQYTINKISNQKILERLKYICTKECYQFKEDGLLHITKLAQGSMRQAITLLDKCKDYSTNIYIENVLKVLGDFSYDVYFKLTNAIIDKNQKLIIEIIENLYNSSNDLKLFTNMYINFVLDLLKYIIFQSFDIIDIPELYKEDLLYTINVEDANKYYNHILDKLLIIKQMIKDDNNIKTTLEIELSQL